MQLLLVTILPSILIVLFFVKSDRFKEPTKEIIKVFFLGIFITIPAYFLNTYLSEIWYSTNASEGLISSFLTAAPVEEGLKLSILYFFVYKMKDFNEPIDGIVYGVTASLGFATLENYDYVFRIAEEYEVSPLDMAITRAFTAVPMHALCGVIMGFYFGMYAFVSGGKNLSLALIVPYIFHGTYNFLCAFPPYYVFVIFILLVFSYLLHNNVKETQKLKKIEHEEKII